MTPKTPDVHVSYILSEAAWDVMEKYKAGQEEHGGRLWRKPIMDYIGEEIVDLVVYWYTFKEQWKDALFLARLAHINCNDPDTRGILLRLIHLMEKGNEDGVEEEERAG